MPGIQGKGYNSKGGIMVRGIFVIDDFPLTLQFIEHHLQVAGYSSIITFENPREVIIHLQNGDTPQLIITDYQMPEMSGLELLERISLNFGIIPGIIATADLKCLNTASISYPVLQKGSPGFVGEMLTLVKKLAPECEISCQSSSGLKQMSI